MPVLLRWVWAMLAGLSFAQTPDNVLIVVNDNSPISKDIGEYYARRRGVPVRNICRLHTTTSENVIRADYDREIAAPIAAFLRKNQLVDAVLYIVTTSGMPLRIPGSSRTGMDMD